MREKNDTSEKKQVIQKTVYHTGDKDKKSGKTTKPKQISPKTGKAADETRHISSETFEKYPKKVSFEFPYFIFVLNTIFFYLKTEDTSGKIFISNTINDGIER